GYTAKLQFLAKEGGWCYGSKTRKRLFFIRPLTQEAKKKLEEILSPERRETEETSLKFSNWSFEEMEAFKEGKGSHSICYELSFWSDLAKWLFLLQEEGKPYELSFEQGEKRSLPDSVRIHFDDLDVWFYLSEVSWPFLIPSLSTVHSPLQLFEQEQRFEKAEYDPIKKEIRFRLKNREKKGPGNQGTPVGEWLFVETQGFYRKTESSLFQKQKIDEKEIGPLLSSAHRELAPFIPIHAEGCKARYQLKFDPQGNLHIDCYLFENGDLHAPQSAIFFPWVYLDGKGFYLVEDWLFDGKEKTIGKGEMADFINRHRVFLHQFPGFQTHLGSLESHLVYRMTDTQTLLFEAELTFPEQYEGARHFDEWVYIPGFGFYLKRENTGRLPLHPGLVVEKEAISSFIASHNEELEQVQGFFLAESPIESSGLEVGLNEQEQILIVPKWHYKEGIDPLHIEFFGDYLYLKGKGFSEIPTASKLPERFRNPLVIPSSQEGAFLAYELEPLRPYILRIDSRM
ncbi:MAG: hypothetical protein HY324_03890, partial [Chlamydiia bacterium]|nr:hypothetical protein [Chlamydiia bacterium]